MAALKRSEAAAHSAADEEIESEGEDGTVEMNAKSQSFQRYCSTIAKFNNHATFCSTIAKSPADAHSPSHDWVPMVPRGSKLPLIYKTTSKGAQALSDQWCRRFQRQVPYSKRLVGIAGLFNTGTNVLSQLLDTNCKFEGRPTNKVTGGSVTAFGPVLYQVPQGKHSPASWLGRKLTPVQRARWERGPPTKTNPSGKEPKNKYENLLTVVIVKDPLTWMASMCRHSYSAIGKWYNSVRCPSLLQNSEVTVQDGLPSNWTHHNTLLDLWTEWYQDYWDVERPRYFVRYEDLLFDQVNALRSVCACAGGTLAEPLQTVADDVKSVGGGHAGGSNLASALDRYANATLRLRRYNTDDLEWMHSHDGATSLMQKLGYFLPASKARNSLPLTTPV